MTELVCHFTSGPNGNEKLNVIPIPKHYKSFYHIQKYLSWSLISGFLNNYCIGVTNCQLDKIV